MPDHKDRPLPTIRVTPHSDQPSKAGHLKGDENHMKVRARAYFDESGSDVQSGYFGVAGLVGSDYQWSVFDRLWKETL